MRFAKWTFRLAGIYGILVLVPPFFLEGQFGRDNPPAVNHPEFYYGFFGCAFAWQLVFLLIAGDPFRYRPAMLAAMVEKASFAIAVGILYAQERVAGSIVGFAAIDAFWLLMFVIAYVRTQTSGSSGVT